jgi:phosphoserine phosphatase RsbU/P
MREKIYLSSFLVVTGVLLYLGRGLIVRSTLVTFGLTFAGTTAVAVLGMALYRVQLELRASRHELARKEAELTFALQVQQALFPRMFPSESGLDFAAVCVPARGISGDYYDVMPLPNGRVGFAIADVSGKGISAAILMSNLHAALRILSAAGYPPGEVCSQLNRHLYQITGDSRFATVFYGDWNPADRSLSYVNAGHLSPIVKGASDTQLLEPGGPPLGIFLESEHSVGEQALQAGDLMVLYSDGITEARNRLEEEFGEARLEAIITANSHKSLGQIQEQVLRAVRKWSGSELEDDMTLLLVRVR